jgi:hypothetical protein
VESTFQPVLADTQQGFGGRGLVRRGGAVRRDVEDLYTSSGHDTAKRIYGFLL